MNVWDEEWFTDDTNVRRVEDGDDLEVFEGRYPKGAELARATLAAAAPEMARTLLLVLESRDDIGAYGLSSAERSMVTHALTCAGVIA